MDTGTPGGSLTFALTSMPMASFYVDVPSFVRGDFSSNSEFAQFFWVNATEPPFNAFSISFRVRCPVFNSVRVHCKPGQLHWAKWRRRRLRTRLLPTGLLCFCRYLQLMGSRGQRYHRHLYGHITDSGLMRSNICGSIDSVPG